MEEQNTLIAICIVTYNQEDFISQCIDSVLNQKTDFNFRIYIGEDNSTDKTKAICEKIKSNYPEKIILIENAINLGLVKNTISVLERIKSDGVKYVAMLDGDDYWIDENKLQKQALFLEQNNNYGLVYTQSASLLNNKIHYKKIKLMDGEITATTMKVTPIPNNTVMFRTALLDLISLNDFVERNFMSCDYAMYVFFSQFTKIKGLDFYSAVVRRGHSSVSHASDIQKRINYIENDIAQFRYLSDMFSEQIQFTAQDEEDHRDFMTYKIAVKFGDYNLAKAVLERNNKIKRYSHSKIYRLKVFFTSNRLFFYIWNLISVIVRKIKFL